MYKMIISFSLFFTVFVGPVSAAMVHMNDGSIIEGEIIQEDKFKVIIRQGLKEYTIYRDEYQKVEEGYLHKKLNIDPAQWGYITVDKARLILKFLEVSRTHANIVENLETVIAKAPKEKQDKLRGMLDANQIITLLVPIYDRFYTDDDLKTLIEFYSGPVGQKHLEVIPLIMQETLRESVQYIKEKQ